MSTERRRLLVLTQYYRPEPNFITADVAEALAREWDVTVVTAHPNYPFGRFYKGARYWWPSRSVERGVTVWRLPFIPDHSNSQVRRLISYLSFLLVTLLFAPWIGGRPAVVWVYQTPFTTGMAALWFKWVTRAKVVFTCADLWPESFTAAGVMRPGPLMRFLFAYSRWINRQADFLVCATRCTLERYHADGIARSRLSWLPVWVDGIPAELESEAAAEAGHRDRSIVYAGNLGPAQHLATVIEAAAQLQSDGIDVRFDFYGAGSAEQELQALAGQLGATNVRFHGRVAPEEVYAICARSLAQVVSLRKTPLFRMTVPSKLYFCLAAGAPILAGLEGESAELAQESGGAFAFDVEDPTSLVDAVKCVLSLSDDARRTTCSGLRTYFHARFAKSRLIDHYLSMMQAVASGVPVVSDPQPVSSFGNA